MILTDDSVLVRLRYHGSLGYFDDQDIALAKLAQVALSGVTIPLATDDDEDSEMAPSQVDLPLCDCSEGRVVTAVVPVAFPHHNGFCNACHVSISSFSHHSIITISLFSVVLFHSCLMYYFNDISLLLHSFGLFLIFFVEQFRLSRSASSNICMRFYTGYVENDESGNQSAVVCNFPLAGKCCQSRFKGVTFFKQKELDAAEGGSQGGQ